MKSVINTRYGVIGLLSLFLITLLLPSSVQARKFGKSFKDGSFCVKGLNADVELRLEGKTASLVNQEGKVILKDRKIFNHKNFLLVNGILKDASILPKHKHKKKKFKKHRFLKSDLSIHIIRNKKGELKALFKARHHKRGKLKVKQGHCSFKPPPETVSLIITHPTSWIQCAENLSTIAMPENTGRQSFITHSPFHGLIDSVHSNGTHFDLVVRSMIEPEYTVLIEGVETDLMPGDEVEDGDFLGYFGERHPRNEITSKVFKQEKELNYFEAVNLVAFNSRCDEYTANEDNPAENPEEVIIYGTN